MWERVSHKNLCKMRDMWEIVLHICVKCEKGFLQIISFTQENVRNVRKFCVKCEKCLSQMCKMCVMWEMWESLK